MTPHLEVRVREARVHLLGEDVEAEGVHAPLPRRLPRRGGRCCCQTASVTAHPLEVQRVLDAVRVAAARRGAEHEPRAAARPRAGPVERSVCTRHQWPAKHVSKQMSRRWSFLINTGWVGGDSQVAQASLAPFGNRYPIPSEVNKLATPASSSTTGGAAGASVKPQV